jgi:hypothetical protein
MNPTSSRRSRSYGVVKGSTAESISVEAKLEPPVMALGFRLQALGCRFWVWAPVLARARSPEAN